MQIRVEPPGNTNFDDRPYDIRLERKIVWAEFQHTVTASVRGSWIIRQSLHANHICFGDHMVLLATLDSCT